MSGDDLKPLLFVGSARKDIHKFPKLVRYDFGFDLYRVQQGKTPGTAKKLKGLSGVMGIIKRYDKDTYRAVYVANLGGAVYVLHCFKKKSKRGIKTPQQDITMIKQRLRTAQMQSKEGEKSQ